MHLPTLIPVGHFGDERRALDVYVHSNALEVGVSQDQTRPIFPSVEWFSRMLNAPGAQPPKGALAESMDVPAADFSTLIGPEADLLGVLRGWPQLRDRAELPPWITAPHLLPRLDTNRRPEWALRVAELRHSPDEGPRIVRDVSRALQLYQNDAAYIEAGYFFSPVSASGETLHPRKWSINWAPEIHERLNDSIQISLSNEVLGLDAIDSWPAEPCIALLDTGDQDASFQVNLTGVAGGPESPHDPDGHGTSIGSLLRAVAPNTHMNSFRALKPGDKYIESPTLINGLNEAMWQIGRYQVIVVAQRAMLGVRDQSGHAGFLRIAQTNYKRGVTMPLVVCAAGNEGPDYMAYPATVPGFIVACGLDWYGRVATYNCRTPEGLTLHVVGALGVLARSRWVRQHPQPCRISRKTCMEVHLQRLLLVHRSP